MLSPADIDAAFAWAGFSVDPSRIAPRDEEYPSCKFEPTEIDFTAPVFNLTLDAQPLDYQFCGQFSCQHRSKLPAVWEQQDDYRGERMINGVPVYFVSDMSIVAFMPDYTLRIAGYGTVTP